MKSTNFSFELPALQDILNKLEKIDSRLESVLISKPQTEVWLNSKDAAIALGITTRTLQTYRVLTTELTDPTHRRKTLPPRISDLSGIEKEVHAPNLYLPPLWYYPPNQSPP